MLLQELGNYGLSGSIIIIINNILVGLFYPYANKVASIGLFFLGIFALGIFCVTSYTFLQSYFLKKILDSQLALCHSSKKILL